MPNRDKVIKGLEHCLSESEHIDDNPCNGCPYFVSDQYGCERTQMEKDALAMLKEQDADIIAMSRFLESHGWDSDSICGKNVEIVVTNGDDDDA